MAACGYVLLLSCIVGNVWCHQKGERRTTHEVDNQRLSGPTSLVEHRNEHPPRLHGDHSKKLLSFPKAEQKKYSLMPLVHRKRYFVLHSKEDLVWDMDGENRRQFMNKVLHYESFEEMFSGLEDEKIKQANKYHKAGHALSHEHGHENEHKHNHEHNPTVNRDDYWIVGKRRFRIIVLIILAVLVGFAILLILAWFFLPRKLIKKIRDQK
ncbi:uncharacterized protein [Narcine bancroftii]|uniref:uncharacterized protein isoform X3 n=1 Tax=Narcine bancroftii TaxID=1343680 RepID=UPI003831F577